MKNIQSKLEIALASGTTWVMVATVVYNGLNINQAILPPEWSAAVNVVLFGLATYLHANHVQTAALSGSTNS